MNYVKTRDGRPGRGGSQSEGGRRRAKKGGIPDVSAMAQPVKTQG